MRSFLELVCLSIHLNMAQRLLDDRLISCRSSLVTASSSLCVLRSHPPFLGLSLSSHLPLCMLTTLPPRASFLNDTVIPSCYSVFISFHSLAFAQHCGNVWLGQHTEAAYTSQCCTELSYLPFLELTHCIPSGCFPALDKLGLLRHFFVNVMAPLALRRRVLVFFVLLVR